MIRRRRVVLLVSLFLSTPLLFACGGSEESEPVIRPVRFLQVFSTGGSRVRSFSGTAQSSVEAPLSFKVGGTVRRLPVEVGDKVRAGQLIADLDPEDYQVQVQEAQASLARARAQERNAQSEFERVRLLFENNNASKSDYDAARASRESAEAGVEATVQRLELTRLQLGYTRLSAPANGAIASVSVEVNQNVLPGQVVVILTSGERHEVTVAMPGVLIPHIREGGSATATFDALPGREFPATVTEVGVMATGMGTTFPVAVLLNEAEPDVRSGMSAEVGFLFESTDQRERYLVPSFAVGEDRDGRFVFVVEPSDDGFGVAHRRAVEIGELTSDSLEIFHGLSDGDRVVIAGVSRIQDGMVVRLQGVQPAGS